jgi:hypothetical protein
MLGLARPMFQYFGFFGIVNRTHRIEGDNSFRCPICETAQKYSHLHSRRYFAFCSIPLLALRYDEPLQAIECHGCQTALIEDALSDNLTSGNNSNPLAVYVYHMVEYDPTIDVDSTVNCRKCGRENSVRSKFCPRCETRL